MTSDKKKQKGKHSDVRPAVSRHLSLVTCHGTNPVCVVMVKAPRAGEVKTRLVPPLSGANAASLAACFAQDWVAHVRRVMPQIIIAYAPADGRDSLKKLLPHDDLLWLAQQGADLGARLDAAARDAFARGFGPVIITGTDSPTLPAALIKTALDSLTAHESDITLCPTDDGGYCLVGLRSLPANLFQNIEWSTSLAYRQTADNARRLNWRALKLPNWYDIDTYTDLIRLRDEILTNNSARMRAPLTYRWLLEHDTLFPAKS